MRRMKKFGAFLAAVWLALTPSQASAQNFRGIIGSQPLAADYDVSSAGYTYVAFYGPGTQGGPFNNLYDLQTGLGFVGASRIVTAGSVTTITAPTGAPFNPVSVGDSLLITYNGNLYRRYVATKTNGAQITVNTAIDLTNGASFTWQKFVTGTAATDGWFSVRNLGEITVIVTVDQINATSIDSTVDCALDSATGTVYTQADTKNYTSATYPGNAHAYVISAGSFDRCRVGFKLTGDAGVQKVSASWEAKVF